MWCADAGLGSIIGETGVDHPDEARDGEEHEGEDGEVHGGEIGRGAKDSAEHPGHGARPRRGHQSCTTKDSFTQ